ncbi:hypothetical protein DYB34_012762 [Aphanomyces astaci]|uniref:Uncharacterized protein n=1 Tax=Aphanomyces astaci TaxID=112090 RepID=A0A3R6W579_APHAT|nr:hypothetical protein DYB34_012762 [Aphanomyces astaci]
MSWRLSRLRWTVTMDTRSQQVPGSVVGSTRWSCLFKWSHKSRDRKSAPPSVNDMSVRWVFTRHQIVRYDFPGIVERLHSDMEDRMLPLTRADVADQVRKIRDRRKSPTHRDIAEVIIQAIQIKLTDEDMRLLETPADVDDPAKWLRWFASVPGDV